MAPRIGGPNLGGRPVGGVRGPWAGPMAGRLGGVYATPPGGYPMPGRGYLPPGRTYLPGPVGPWGQPRPIGGYPVYATPPGYPTAPVPARGWRRGGYLPPSYPGAVVQDFGRYHLRRPPDGYNWVREGNEFLLVSSGTGLIFDVAPAY